MKTRNEVRYQNTPRRHRVKQAVTVRDLNTQIAVQEKLLEQLRKKRDELLAVSGMESRAALRAREYVENTEALAEAKATGRNISFEAHDGCEVTVTPDGKVFFNASDWM